MDYVEYFRNEAEYYKRPKLKKDLLLAAEVIENLKQSPQAGPEDGSAEFDGLCAKQVIKWLGDTYSMVRSSTTALNMDDRERATHLKSLLDAAEAIRKLHL